MVKLNELILWSKMMICKKYSDIWNVGNCIKKEVDWEPIYNNFFLKTKAGFYRDETTGFDAKKRPKAGSNYIFWSVIWTDSVLKKDKKYFPQVFLREFKYIEKGKKVIKYITDDLKISSDESDEEGIKLKNHDGVFKQIYMCKTIISQTGDMYTTIMCGVFF